jgi:hypothetical protein
MFIKINKEKIKKKKYLLKCRVQKAEETPKKLTINILSQFS